MTTTRINHTGHAHASTTAARTACRKASTVTVTTYPAATVGNGKAIHLAVTDLAGRVLGVRCGSGLTRNGHDSTYRSAGELALGDITCRGCSNKFGHAHG